MAALTRRLAAGLLPVLILLFTADRLPAATARIVIPPGVDSVRFPSGPVLAGRELVRCGADTLVPERDYRYAVDFRYLVLTPPRADTVSVRFATLPGFDGTFRRFAPLSDPSPPLQPPGALATGRAPSAVADRLEVTGTKRLSFGVGRERGGLIEQSLWLSIRGTVGPHLTVEGTVSDRSTATETITRRPSEFEKVSLRAYGPGFAAEFGDTEWERADFRLFTMSRRLSGLQVSGHHEGLRGNGLLGERRGRFRSRRFVGEEGKQGPYLLTSGSRTAIVPGSEAIWIDGERLSYGVERDYVMDYPTGALTFTASRPVSRETRITADFEEATTDYQTFTYQAGTGFERDGWSLDWLLHREWDDADQPRSFTLTDEDRDALGAAGDSAALAVRSGIDSVGPGEGSYNRVPVAGFFEYAGPGQGEFNISFSYLGPGAGDYRAKGDGTFFFAGTGQGDWAPVVALPLPGEARLFAVRAGRAWSRHALQVEWARSDQDANRLSGLGDVNDAGSAWLGRYSLGSEQTRLAGEVFWRHRDDRFRAPGRDEDVEFDRRWGDSVGTSSVGDDQFGSRLRYGLAGRYVALDVEGRTAGDDDRALRTAGRFAWTGRGQVSGNFETLRRDRGTVLKFDRASVDWRLPVTRLPLSVRVEGEQRTEGSGYRFGDLNTRVGPSRLNVEAGLRRTDTLAGTWQKHSDLYRLTGRWQQAGPTVDGGLTLHYQRREFSGFTTGSQDRVLAESRWIVRESGWTLRLEHRLSRTQSASTTEEYVPVQPGYGDYREENGQIIEDPLGDLVRVIRPSAYGELARQSEKRAAFMWPSGPHGLRTELSLATEETAADAGLPRIVWLLPWQAEANSPTRRHTAQAEFSGGTAARRWVGRVEWQRRLDIRTTRPRDFRALRTDLTLRTRVTSAWNVQLRTGGGVEREQALFPYDLRFVFGAASPAWQVGTRTEIVVPLFYQRYWSADGSSLADWQRLGVRSVTRVGRRSRLVIEPSISRTVALSTPLPLVVAEGRPPGVTAEWRIEGSVDLSGALIGRLLYRGRTHPERAPVHRADISLEATF